MKERVAAHYQVLRNDWGQYEFDHLIPLEIGGDSSIENIWPQPHGRPDGSGGKDVIENELGRELATGQITQAVAVRKMYAWFGAESMAERVLDPNSAN